MSSNEPRIADDRLEMRWIQNPLDSVAYQPVAYQQEPPMHINYDPRYQGYYHYQQPYSDGDLPLHDQNSVIITDNVVRRLHHELDALGATTGTFAKQVLGRDDTRTLLKMLQKRTPYQQMKSGKAIFDKICEWLMMCEDDRKAVLAGRQTVCCPFEAMKSESQLKPQEAQPSNAFGIVAEKRGTQNSIDSEGVDAKRIRTGYEEYPEAYLNNNQPSYQQYAPDFYYNQWYYHYQQMGFAAPHPMIEGVPRIEDPEIQQRAQEDRTFVEHRVDDRKELNPAIGSERKDQQGPNYEDQKDPKIVRRSKTVFNEAERARLEYEYQLTRYPNASKITCIALELHLSHRIVRTYFQNRRTKDRKQGVL